MLWRKKRFCGGLADCLRWQGSQYLLFGHRENRCLVWRKLLCQQRFYSNWLPPCVPITRSSRFTAGLPADARGQPVGCCYGEITWDEGWLGLELT
jgi:hypothetical protein